MGLDFSHCNARWGYIGFMHFRTRLAAEAGIALHCTESFAFTASGKGPAKTVYLCLAADNDDGPNYGNLIGRQPVLKWENIKDDIVPFLNHSDCDGILTPEECAKVHPRLSELIFKWPEDDTDKIKALELVEGMKLCVERRENLVFC